MGERHKRESYPVQIEESYQSNAKLIPMCGFFQPNFPAWSDVITF